MRYRYRLIISMLVVCIPLMVALAVVLTTKSTARLTGAAEHRAVDVTRAVALRIEDWMSERHQTLAVAADELSGNSSVTATAEVLGWR